MLFDVLDAVVILLDLELDLRGRDHDIGRDTLDPFHIRLPCPVGVGIGCRGDRVGKEILIKVPLVIDQPLLDLLLEILCGRIRIGIVLILLGPQLADAVLICDRRDDLSRGILVHDRLGHRIKHARPVVRGIDRPQLDRRPGAPAVATLQDDAELIGAVLIGKVDLPLLLDGIDLFHRINHRDGDIVRLEHRRDPVSRRLIGTKLVIVGRRDHDRVHIAVLHRDQHLSAAAFDDPACGGKVFDLILRDGDGAVEGGVCGDDRPVFVLFDRLFAAVQTAGISKGNLVGG